MKLPTWDAFSNYLFTVKKLDENNISSLKGRYKTVTTYFATTIYKKQTVYEFFAYLKNVRLLKAGSLNNYIKILRHLNKYLEIIPDFLDDFSYFKAPQNHIETLSQDELDNIISCGYKYSFRLGVIIETLAQTGVRNGELCNLQWDDYKKDVLILRDTKSGEIQYVPLLPELSEKIGKLEHYSHGYIFATGRGRMYGHNLNKNLQIAAKQAGIKRHVSAHLFRHTVATLASKRNRSMAKVKEFMRHKSIDTTMRYVHMDLEDAREVAQTVSPNSMTFMVLKQLFEEFYKTISIYPFPVQLFEEDGEIVIKALSTS